MRKFGLREKLFFLQVGTVLLIALMLVASIKPVLTHKLRSELSRKGEFMAGHLAMMSVEYLLEEKFIQLQVMVRDFSLHDSDAFYIFIQDENDSVIAHSFEEGFPTGLKIVNPIVEGTSSSLEHLKLGKNAVIDIAMPIMNGELGHVHVGLSEESILASVSEVVWLVMAIIAGVLMLVMLVAILFGRRLTGPLVDLINVSEAVGKGDLAGRVSLHSRDELGQLGKSFNSMIDKLQQTTVSKEEYRQQTAFLHEVLEAIPYPFYVVNVADYTIVLANSAAGNPDVVKDSTCHALTHKQNEPCGLNSECECPLEKIKETHLPVTVEHVHYNDNNQQRYYEIHGYPILDSEKKLVQMIEFSLDITDRKLAEIALTSSREELEQINKEIDGNRRALQVALDEISTNIQTVIKQKNLQVRYENPTLIQCYQAKECGKVDCPCFGEDAQRCWQIAGTFCGGKVQGSFAQKIENCLDCIVFQEATGDSLHRVGELFNNMMHILEMKNLELEKSNQELKETHSQMLQQEKMASIGQLAAGVAHEINNPMGFITSNLGMFGKYEKKISGYLNAITKILEELSLDEDHWKRIREKRKEFKIDYILEDLNNLVEESLDGANRVKEIVKNLKTFARLDEHVSKEADINECLESTLKIIWNEIKYKADVVKEYGELPLLKCLPMELNQVFMNILINAAQAIEKMGTIRIKTWHEKQQIFVTIADTGSGIAKDKISKIFEPFFTTKDVGKGTGLGMSIAYDIIKKHNGEIYVSSTEGVGTTFTIELPLGQ